MHNSWSLGWPIAHILPGSLGMAQESACFTIRFRGSPTAVRRALREIRDELASAGATSDQRGRIETVLAEVLNNIVEHAFSDQPNGLIEASGRRQNPGWSFQVYDSGCPLPEERLPAKNMPTVDTDFEDLPEGGFGWAMVHMLTEEISYRRYPDRNCLKFSVPDG